jgi:hypothetical protein
VNTSDLEKLIAYIKQLTQATSQRRIEWHKVNPTTFLWSKSGGQPHGRVVIQSVVRFQMTTKPAEPARQVTAYILQVVDETRGEVLKIDSGAESGTEAVLKNLFETVIASSSVDGLAFLGSLLNP